MKIVLNGCYGGFGLSYEAMYLYLYAKTGQAPYFYADIPTYNDKCMLINRVYKRITLPETKKYLQNYIYCTTEDQGETLNSFPKAIFSGRDVDRTDPTLISVVEIMGTEEASGRFAFLEIAEVPDGTLYKIDNYDGIESLITQYDDDWKTAVSQIQSNNTKCDIESIWCDIESIWNLIKPEEEND